MPRKPRLAKVTLSQTHVRVAIYTRRSTDEENQPFTIEAQESKLDSYVASQEGWTIVAKFSDDASGAKIERPDLARALAAARAGKFDVLLVYRVDRFSRRIRDLVMLLDDLDRSGVVFRSATEPFDTSTPAGRMLVQMLGVFAEFEREMIIDRVINGMEKKASKGQWTLGIAPYGFSVDPTTKHLIPVKDEVVIVKKIFHLYTVRRIGTRAVANELNGHGYRRRSGRPWSFKTVTDALLNPAYIGTVAFRDVQAEDAHPAVIDREVFALADHILAERGENPAKAAGVASNYHLTGKILCPLCGKAYLGTAATGRNRTYRYYTCFTRNRYGTSHCNAPRIEAETFDDLVLAAVGDFYRTRTDLITEAITAAQNDYRATKATVEAELNTVSAQMAQKEAAIDRYFTDYEEGKIDKALLERRIEKLGLELRDLRRHRDELHLRLEDEPQHLTGVDLTALNAYIGEVIDRGTTAVRKSLCEAAIHVVHIDLTAAKATPVFRVNLAVAGDSPNDEGAPAGNPAGAHIRSSQGVRERIPPVEPRGLEPLTPTLPVWCATSCATAPRARRGRHSRNITHRPGRSSHRHSAARRADANRRAPSRISSASGRSGRTRPRRIMPALAAQHHRPQVVRAVGERVAGQGVERQPGAGGDLSSSCPGAQPAYPAKTRTSTSSSRMRSGSADRSTVPMVPSTRLKPRMSPAGGRDRARQIAASGCTGPPSKTTDGSLATPPQPPSTSPTGTSVGPVEHDAERAARPRARRAARRCARSSDRAGPGSRRADARPATPSPAPSSPPARSPSPGSGCTVHALVAGQSRRYRPSATPARRPGTPSRRGQRHASHHSLRPAPRLESARDRTGRCRRHWRIRPLLACSTAPTEHPIDTPYGAAVRPDHGRRRRRPAGRVPAPPRPRSPLPAAPHPVPGESVGAARDRAYARSSAPCAVGGLRPELGPGTFVLPDQLVDRTSGRVADVLRRRRGARELRRPVLPDRPGRGTGGGRADRLRPRPTAARWWSSRARASRPGPSPAGTPSLGGTVVNMTGHPEAVLARELGLCYTAIALVTDLDAGVEGEHGVTQEEVFRVFGENTRTAADPAARRGRRAAARRRLRLPPRPRRHRRPRRRRAPPAEHSGRQPHHEPAATVHVGHRRPRPGAPRPGRARWPARARHRRPRPSVSASGVRAGVAPERHVEDAGQVGLGDAAAAVGHREPAARVVPATGERDRAVGRGVPDRVAQQVGHDPGQLRLAALHGRPARLGRDQPDPAGRGHRRGRGDRVGDHVAQRDRRQGQPQRAGVDAGQLEQVVDQATPSGRSPPGSGGGSRRPSPGRRPRRPPAPRPSRAGRPAAYAGRATPTRPARAGSPPSAARARAPRPPTSRRAASRRPSQTPTARLTAPAMRQHDEQHPQVVLGDEHARATPRTPASTASTVTASSTQMWHGDRARRAAAAAPASPAPRRPARRRARPGRSMTMSFTNVGRPRTGSRRPTR